MESVKLKVTLNVLAQIEKAAHQEQIAISGSTSLLARSISAENGQTRISIIIASAVKLDLGDTGAIWRSHNRSNLKAFDALFDFLSKYPDKEFEFVCSIAE